MTAAAATMYAEHRALHGARGGRRTGSRSTILRTHACRYHVVPAPVGDTTVTREAYRQGRRP